jgi:hypothetical protein
MLRCLVPIALFCLIGLATVEGPPHDRRTQQISYILEGFAKNRDAFDVCTCRFTYVRGTAASLNDALKGTVAGATPQYGVWLVKGRKYFCQLHPDEGRAAQAFKEAYTRSLSRGDKVFSTPGWVQSLVYMSDGSYHLSYNGLARGGQLTPPGRAGESPAVTPWKFALSSESMHPAVRIKECLDGKYFGHLKNPGQIQGNDPLTVEVADQEAPSDQHWHSAYTFDPAKGFLPVFMAFDSKKRGRVMEVHILECRQCSKGRWFPIHCICVVYPRNGGSFDVTDMKVTQLDVDKAPREESFAFTVPERSQLHDNDLKPGGAITTVNKGDRIGLNDLRRLYIECLQNFKR